MYVHNCPHCQGKMSVPEKSLGQTVHCPRCNQPFVFNPGASNRFPPAGAPAKQLSTAAAYPPGHPVAPPPVARPVATMVAAPPAPMAVSQAPPMPPTALSQPPLPTATMVPPAPPPAPPPAMAQRAMEATTARLIKPPPSEAVLSPAADGKLPGLQLADEAKAKGTDFGALKSNPALMIVLFCVSIGSSAALLLMDFSPKATGVKTQAEAREQLRPFYEIQPGTPLLPYQVELRSAQQAFSKGDRKTEKQYYRKVMNRLLAEDRNPYVGITGSPVRDRDLQEYLSILLEEEQSVFGP